MTTVERLIRTACELRKGAIQQEPRRTVPNREVPWAAVPLAAQQLVRKYLAAKQEAERLSTAIDALGWDVPGDSCSKRGLEPKTLYRDYRKQEQLQEASNKERRDRLSKIDELRNRVHIQCLGLTTLQAKPIIEKLERDLEKV